MLPIERRASDDGPIVSAILPFTGEKHLHESIASLLAQTLTSIEIIAVGTRNSGTGVSLAEAFPDVRLLVLSSPDEGLGAALNTGIRSVRGRYVAFAAAADVAEPWRLAHQAELIHCRQCDAVFSPPTLIDGNGRVVHNSVVPRFFDRIGDEYPGGMLRYLILNACGVCLSTMMVRTEVLQELGPFSETLLEVPDYDYWLRMAAAGKRMVRLSRQVARHRWTGRDSSLLFPDGTAAKEAITCIYRALRDTPGAALAQAFPDMLPPGSLEATGFDRAMITLSHPLANAIGSAMIVASFLSPEKSAPTLDLLASDAGLNRGVANLQGRLLG